MRDPFKITDLTAISFSGGRTSGYMLWRVLQANGGKLPDGVEVCFANTGKEREETLQFVRDCAANWNVPIRWVEYRDNEAGFALVDFESASRNGEPFEAIIKKRNYLPNPMARFCTVELKIMPQRQFLRSIGWVDWADMVGIRADEPRRVAKIMANPSGGHAGPEREVPLAAAGITKKHIGDFWKAQAFDLALIGRNGVTMEGNCDLCFLKARNIVLTSIKAEPSRAIWWAKQEGSITNAKIANGGFFRNDRPSYQQMHDYALAQVDMFDAADDESIPCFCGD
jgi:3'-phosphoadenosine 5'-phosphosulfate sulfotransferase (PAPS reductase)/FAD synthetase